MYPSSISKSVPKPNNVQIWCFAQIRNLFFLVSLMDKTKWLHLHELNLSTHTLRSHAVLYQHYSELLVLLTSTCARPPQQQTAHFCWCFLLYFGEAGLCSVGLLAAVWGHMSDWKSTYLLHILHLSSSSFIRHNMSVLSIPLHSAVWVSLFNELLLVLRVSLEVTDRRLVSTAFALCIYICSFSRCFYLK